MAQKRPPNYRAHLEDGQRILNGVFLYCYCSIIISIKPRGRDWWMPCFANRIVRRIYTIYTSKGSLCILNISPHIDQFICRYLSQSGMILSVNYS